MSDGPPGRAAKVNPPATEPDLAAILRLLDPAAFAPGRNWTRAPPPWAAQRDVAVVALCWLVGLRPLQIEHAKRRDWRLGGDTLLARGVGRYAGVRERQLPVLERARDALGGYLEACPLPHPPDGPLILRADGTGFAERDVTSLNARLRKASGGVVPTLADLTGRFRRYVENTGAADGTVERLVGRTGPYDTVDPGSKQLRRALERLHPGYNTHLDS